MHASRFPAQISSSPSSSASSPRSPGLRRAALALAVVALATPWLAQAQSTQGPVPVRVGVVGPFTGPSADFGVPMLNGIKLAVEEINAVGGYYAFGKELCNGNSVFDFDTTKLSVHTLDIGLAGIEVYDILRDEYDIQIEFGDIGNILAYLSIGDRPQEVERLVSALAEIKRRYHTDGAGLLSQEYIDPEVAASPQEAFYAPKKGLPLRETEGMVCSEFVMCYPPGIPILAPGERITAEILDYIEYAKAKGCSMTGPEDPDILRLNVLA